MSERRITSWYRNIEIENDPVAEKAIRKAIKKHFPTVKKIIKIKVEDLQKAGVDYVIELEDGFQITVDVKVRRSIENNWSTTGKQDFLLEVRQGEKQPGWAIDDKLLTDVVLFVFPWADEKIYKKNGWKTSYAIAHKDLVESVSTMVRTQRHNVFTAGDNGRTYSYCIAATAEQIEKNIR